MKYTDNEILEKVKEIIVDLQGFDLSKLEPETKLIDDLGFDSLDAVEIIMDLEREFNIAILDSETENQENLTIQSLVDIVKKHLTE